MDYAFKEDVRRYFLPDEIPRGMTFWKMIGKVLKENTLWVILLFRVSRWVRLECRIPVLRLFLRMICSLIRKPLFFFHGIHIDLGADIGPGFYIGHHGGIWIGPVRMGSHCNISQNVTIGIGGKGAFRGIPEIGDNVYIGPGAVLFGKITVGSNVAVGANAVLSKSTPENAVVVGNPARIVNYEGSKGLIDLIEADREI
jgi:serine O-acetyltransferase